MTTPAPVEVAGATKRFGDTLALDGVDLWVGDAEILALVGPSGCGKSTLLRIIGGLESLDSGSVRLGGRLVDDGANRLPPERRGIGLVFQEHALFPHLTVRNNVAFGLRDLPSSEQRRRVDEMLTIVSLPQHGDRYPHELSGGERQRIALARALAPEPELMLFDEPFASLDRNLRVDLRRHVVDALRATGTAAVMVTHDQHEALAIGDRVAVMRSGRIVQTDTPSSVYHSPVDEFVAAFLDEASFLPIERRGGAPATVLGPIDSATSSTQRAMVRPDDLEFTDAADGLDVEVLSAEFRGMHWFAEVRLADGLTVRALSSHLEPPRVGDRSRIRLVTGHSQVPVEPSD